MGIFPADRMPHEGLQLALITAQRKDFHVSNAQKRRRTPAEYGRSLFDEAGRRVWPTLRRACRSGRGLRVPFHARATRSVPDATKESALVVGTPKACIASDARNSRTLDRSTARPS
eukprot:CAMPEP_0117547108 /NCGR_PEP_ID=MMETSP0784-20121206/46951_1 /TAXON_ID=39447 /ORGANISM="" /LENGTH=115 /DNA_ID=CAMNT_0005343997 /DNA_START=245 /DNA_END=588 /DNA_ORIENTATION=+